MSYFIKLLRNDNLFATHELAIEGIKAKLGNINDGEICAASYGTGWGESKTIFAIKRKEGGYTIFDNENASASAAKAIEALDSDKNGASADNKVNVQVVQVDGKIETVTVTTSDIASAALLGAKDDASTAETAFGKIKKIEEGQAGAITAAIAELDSVVGATAADGNAVSVLTGITQEDGKLTGKTEVKLASVAKTGSAEDVSTEAIAGSEEQVAVEGTNVKAQIGNIAKALKNVSKNSAKYKVVSIEGSELTALGTNVKEAYKVVSYTGEWDSATDKADAGSPIKIYKDSTLKEAKFEDQKLKLTYILANGEESPVEVDMTSLVLDTEVENGIQNVGGKLSLKVDTASESFLTAGADGVKLSGVQTAIDDAVKNAKVGGEYEKTTYSVPFEAKVEQATAHVTKDDKVHEAFKKVEKTIGLLTDEVLANEKVTAEAINKVAQSTGIIKEGDIIGYVKVAYANYIADAVSVHDATVKLDKKLKEAVDGSSNALTGVSAGNNAITVGDKASDKSQTVSLKLDPDATNALSITQNGLMLSNVIDCGTY